MHHPRWILVALALALALAGGVAAAAGGEFRAALARAHQLIEAGRYPQARHVLAEEVALLAREPAHEAVRLAALGNAAAGLQDYPAAADHLRGALALANHLPDGAAQRLRYLLGQVELRRGDARAAVAALERWLEQAVDVSGEAHGLLGAAYLEAGRLSEAVEHLERAAAATGSNAPVWDRLLAAAHQRSGDPRRAASRLQRSLERSPGSAEDWLALAALRRAAGDQASALAVLELARRRGWLRTEADLLALAALQVEVGLPYRAARLLEAVLQSGRLAETPAHRRLLIEAWRQAGEVTQALEACAVATGRHPEPRLHLLESQLAVESGRWQQALAAAERVLAAAAGADAGLAAAARLSQGIALARQRRWAAARESLELAAIDPAIAPRARSWLEHVRRAAARE